MATSFDLRAYEDLAHLHKYADDAVYVELFALISPKWDHCTDIDINIDGMGRAGAHLWKSNHHF